MTGADGFYVWEEEDPDAAEAQAMIAAAFEDIDPPVPVSMDEQQEKRSNPFAGLLDDSELLLPGEKPADEARRLTSGIRTGLGDIARMVERAFEIRAWEHLGYGD